ncbi:MAG: GxxExxY protein [Candidatus Symbiothrix sp.]|jgi:GxxExxY protein|nr:GxxExxY protein [Candidatus Symbiothrix sp.]
MELLCRDLTVEIIKAFYKVYNQLGYGFLERVYQNALFFELKNQGFDCKAQYKIDVYYLDQKVGEYYADIIVNDKVILELKAAESLCEAHECQLLNYLKATNMEVGLLLNFGKTPEYKRKIYSNKNK